MGGTTRLRLRVPEQFPAPAKTVFGAACKGQHPEISTRRAKLQESSWMRTMCTTVLYVHQTADSKCLTLLAQAQGLSRELGFPLRQGSPRMAPPPDGT